MSRRKHAETLEDDEPGLDISSLIDVCFLLLIYFLVTSTIMPREQDLPLTLPAAAPSETPPTIEPMLISVMANGSIVLNKNEQLDGGSDEPRDLPQLTERLTSYVQGAEAAGSEALVQIHADNQAKQQAVIDVLNALAGVGVSKVTFTDLGDL